MAYGYVQLLFFFSFLCPGSEAKSSLTRFHISSRATHAKILAINRPIIMNLNHFHVSQDQGKSACNTDCYRSDTKRFFSSRGEFKISVVERFEMDIEVLF